MISETCLAQKHREVLVSEVSPRHHPMNISLESSRGERRHGGKLSPSRFAWNPDSKEIRANIAARPRVNRFLASLLECFFLLFALCVHSFFKNQDVETEIGRSESFGNYSLYDLFVLIYS